MASTSENPAADPPDDSQPVAADVRPVAGLVEVRRAPRYRAFALAGVLLGALAGVVLVLTSGRDGGDGDQTGFVLFFVVLGLAVIGAILGGLAALLADRAPRR